MDTSTLLGEFRVHALVFGVRRTGEPLNPISPGPLVIRRLEIEPVSHQLAKMRFGGENSLYDNIRTTRFPRSFLGPNALCATSLATWSSLMATARPRYTWQHEKPRLLVRNARLGMGSKLRLVIRTAA